GRDDFLKFGFVILFADEAENVSSLVNAAFFGEPARAAGNAKEHGQEENGRQNRDAELPTPFDGAKLKRPDSVVGEIGEKEAEDGRATDAKAANKAKNYERRPTPRKGTADGGYDVKDSHETETVAAADGI